MGFSRMVMKPAMATSSTPWRSRASTMAWVTSTRSGTRATTSEGTPWAAATSVARHGRSTTTTATGSPAARMASRLVPLPDARTPIRTSTDRTSGGVPDTDSFPVGRDVLHLCPNRDPGGGMDFNKLSKGERIVLVAGVLLVIDLLFLPWHKIKISALLGVNVSRTGVQSPNSGYAILALLIDLVMITQIVAARFTSAKLPNPPSPWGQVHLF